MALLSYLKTCNTFMISYNPPKQLTSRTVMISMFKKPVLKLLKTPHYFSTKKLTKTLKSYKRVSREIDQHQFRLRF